MFNSYLGLLWCPWSQGHWASLLSGLNDLLGLFMGYGAGCEETTWWAKAMRKIFGHPVCTYFLYKLSFTPCRSSEY
jgi:hypothetical protein